MTTQPKYIKNSDPKVLEFLRYLGIEPEGTTKVIIVIEPLKPLKVRQTRRVKTPPANGGQQPANEPTNEGA